jgi:hypothetical protein
VSRAVIAWFARPAAIYRRSALLISLRELESLTRPCGTSPD